MNDYSGSLPMANLRHTLHKTGLMKRLSVLSLAVLLSACATTPEPQQPLPRGPVAEVPQPGPVVTPEPEIDAPQEEIKPEEPVIVEVEPPRDGLTPPHMQGRDIKRLALLLPFSASSERLREEAASMLEAAEMAVFDRDKADVLLIALDTGGSESGGASAARAAIKSGADVILGPVLARSVRGASREARRDNTPVIAFSTDQTVAGNGTYLLSFPPEAEVERIVDFAASTGVQNFAYLGPQNTYGQRVRGAYGESIRRVGGELTQAESYAGRDISVMQTPARKLAQIYKDHEDNAEPDERMAFEAIILPEGGTELRSLAPLLPFYDLDPADVQFLGTSRWYNEDTVREPALNGGIFAAPDKDARDRFKGRYDSRFGNEPSQLASLAYDAVNVAAYVSSGKLSERHRRAQDPQGFFGADGFVRFNYDGTPERGLAVYQIQNGRFVIIDPAPKSATGPS